jgi:heat shock protein HtpX
MVSALLKISGRSDVQGVPNEVRGMFFDNARSFAGNLFSTHPTIDQRIKSLVSYAGAKVLSPSSQRRQGPWA